MGTKLSVSLNDVIEPETAPRIDRPPTFDPLYGFPNGRKPREMKVSMEEMDEWNLKPGQRDYCAHLLIPLMRCQKKNAPFAGHMCDTERHNWDRCEYDDYIMRIKEYEREHRLLQRMKRKADKQMLANSLDFLDSFIGTSDDLKKRCVDVFERLAKHTESNVKGNESRDLCWVMLARLLFRCDEETLRSLGSRVSKRLIDVTRQPMSAAIVVFIRAAVDRIPALMAQNQKTLRGLCLSVLDFGVLTAHSQQNCDILELAIDTFAACFGFSESTRILSTLKALIDESVISEASSDHLIFIEQIKFSDRRNLLIRTMILLYRRSLQKAKKEKQIDLGAFLNLAERALRIDNAEVTVAVLVSIRTIMQRCRFGVLLYGQTILSLLMERVFSSEVACAVLTEISEVFGVSSNISKHPDFSSLTKIGTWVDSPHALQISELLSSVLRTSSFTLKRHTLLETQHNLCFLLLMNGPTVPLMKLLNTFLLLNNEQIPVPIQIARTLAYRWCSVEYEAGISQEIRHCRVICDSIAHPRLQLLTNVKDAVAQIGIDAENERKEEEIEAAMLKEEKVEVVAVEPPKVEVASTASQTDKVEQEVDQVTPNSKRSLETVSTNDAEEAQPVKKTKVEESEPIVNEVEKLAELTMKPRKPKNNPKIVNPPKQTLGEGEISVEDMLLDFCA